MIIDKDLSKYIVNSEDTILCALDQISTNCLGFVFSVTEAGVVEGILSNGDFRRWVITTKNINLNQSVSIISNKNFKFLFCGEEEKAHSMITVQIPCLPILDSQKRLVAVAIKREEKITIGQYTVGDKSPVFIIAEIGNNHNGNMDFAKKLIDCAAAAGADCAKFQLRNIESLYHNRGDGNDHREDLGSQYVLDLLSRFQLDIEEMYRLFDYCKEKSILPLCTPWDIKSVEQLQRYGMEAYKVSSADLTNHDLLEVLASTGKPLICSTGMSTEQEIKEAVALLKRCGAEYVLLQCNATYPPPFKDINLNYMERLKEIGSCPVGYSGHERGFHVPLAAVAMGAKVIEKHFTLDRTLEGNDHKVSLLPSEFKIMTRSIRELEESFGDSSVRRMSQGELINRESLAKSLIINQDLDAGEIITSEMIEVKSPGKGLQPNYKKRLLGRFARRRFHKGDFFYPSDLLEGSIKARHYTFTRPWGIPVRYHDFQKLLLKTNPDLLEFHLSYKDMDYEITNFFNRSYEMGLVVHSPELFAGDHILDLCSEDTEYRKRSVRELQKVVSIARELKSFFVNGKYPLIVVNVGGYTRNEHLPKGKRKMKYDILEESLSQLDTQGVELILQTMPPFPWHFGGQQYHNLFIDPEDIAVFCSKMNMRICLDLSHSRLSCSYFHYSFKVFLRLVGPYTAHLHIADAKGVDGEGLQIGEGDIDFPALREDLEQYIAPDASFIPEIWQGHSNDGEGFWIALDKLENILP